MRRRNQFRPTLDGVLEDRVVMSSGLIHAEQFIAVPLLAARIYGVSHSFPANPGVPGSGCQINLQGLGHVILPGVGAFYSVGTISGNNTVAPPFNAESTGTVTLFNYRGSITLSLIGPSLNVLQNSIPTVYNFAVTNATGQYTPILARGVTGTATLVLHHVRTPFFTVPFNGIPGNFALRLVATVPVVNPLG